MQDAITKQLTPHVQEIRQHVSMAKLTSFKIGGPARYLVTVNTIESLRFVLDVAARAGLSTIILGGGSNMLVADIGYTGIVIRLAMTRVTIEGNRVTAEAGVKTVALAQQTVAAGLTGFEWAVGIPGTIGGAVRGNAGAVGGEMRDNVVTVEALVDGDIATFTNADCGFDYRHSAFKENGGIILSTTLELAAGDPATGAKKMHDALMHRMTTQPKGFASTGCIFKNIVTPDGQRISAGKLIDEAGLKGTELGGARVSEAHGNFVINTGEAKAEEIRELVERIKAQVYATSGYQLHEEIQYVGF